MRQAEVLYKGEPAGLLVQHDDGSFTFTYYDDWFTDSGRPGISFSLPKDKKKHESEGLFAGFYNIMPEGEYRKLLCRALRIDDDDDFGLLLYSAEHDSIGALLLRRVA